MHCDRVGLSLDVAAEADGRLALCEAARGHDQHAIVVRGAYLAPIVAADQRPLWRQDFEATEILDEFEAITGGRDRFGHLDDALPGVRVEVRSSEGLRILALQDIEGDQKAQHDIDGNFRCAAFPMLSAL